jgi:hypothetical protein
MQDEMESKGSASFSSQQRLGQSTTARLQNIQIVWQSATWYSQACSETHIRAKPP